MRMPTSLTVIGVCLVATAVATAQRPDRDQRTSSRSTDSNNIVDRMMEFDTNHDGKLSKSEVTDTRLHRLFDRADRDKNGTVTRSELNALMVRERASARGGPSGFGGPGGPPGMGRFPGGPPRPGQILPPMLRQRLSLTPEQEKQVDTLQKEVDAKLEKILTAEQNQQLKELRERGPGGFGPPPGGFGPPPGGFGPPPGGFGPPPGGFEPPDRGSQPDSEGPPS
jgi:Spy/CpxP family protein refolding chaperone